MFYNISNSIKKDAINFVVSKKIPIFASSTKKQTKLADIQRKLRLL
jgi:hypothetical protein